MDMMPDLVRQKRLSAGRVECVLSERTDPVAGNHVRRTSSADLPDF